MYSRWQQRNRPGQVSDRRAREATAIQPGISPDHPVLPLITPVPSPCGGAAVSSPAETRRVGTASLLLGLLTQHLPGPRSRAERQASLSLSSPLGGVSPRERKMLVDRLAHGAPRRADFLDIDREAIDRLDTRHIDRLHNARLHIGNADDQSTFARSIERVAFHFSSPTEPMYRSHSKSTLRVAESSSARRVSSSDMSVSSASVPTRSEQRRNLAPLKSTC